MALRRLAFQVLAAGSAYFDSSQDSDDVRFATFTASSAANTGTVLDLNTNDAVGIRKATFVTGVAGIAIDAGGLRISNLNLTPSANSDAVSKQYVDNLVAGVDWKVSARATPTGNLASPTTAPGATIDGVTMVANDRFLLKAQSAPAENGIYVWNSAASATRSTDGSAGFLTSGAAVFITEGTANGNTAWILTTDDPITVGTTAQVWSQFVGPGTYTQGAGITISGNTISNAMSVGLTGPTYMTVGSSPLTGAGGTITLTWNSNIAQNAVFAGLSTGGAGSPTFRALVAADIPALGYQPVDADLTAIAGLGFTASALLRKTAADTWTLDTSTYLTSATGVTTFSAGTTGLTPSSATSGAITLAGTLNILNGGTGQTTALAAFDALSPTTTTGDISYYGASNSVRLAGNSTATKQFLSMTSSVPSWGVLAYTDIPGVVLQYTIGGVATSANVTAANLNTLTAGSGSDASALHTHAGLSASAISFSANAGVGGVAKGDAVYFHTDGTATKGASTVGVTSQIVGIAAAAYSAAAAGTFVTRGLLTGAGSGWTPGQQIFMNDTGGLTNDPSSAAISSRRRTIMVGTAKTATDLLVDIRDFGMKP